MRQYLSGKNLRALSALSLSAFLLSGCGQDTGNERLSIGLPNKFLTGRADTSAPSYNYAWWNDFQDPVLAHLIAVALRESPSLAIADARVREAEAGAAGARNFPTGAGSIERRSIDGSGSTVGELDIEWSVFGGRQQQAEAATARVAAARFGADGAYQRLVADVATAYVDLRFNQQSRVLRQQDLRSRRETLESLRSQVASGNATRLDILRAEALVVETQSAFAALAGEIARQKNRIATLTGKSVSSLGVDLGFRGHQPVPGRLVSAGVPAQLVLSHPDIRSAEALYKAAVNDVDAARRARYPSLTLSGNIFAPLDGGSVVETAVAGVTLPIFQQPLLAAREDAAEARAERAYSEWTLAVLTAVENVETALAGIRSTGEATGYAERLVQLNTQALDAAQELIRIGGMSTILELLESEREVTASRLVLAQSRRNYALNAIALYRALGIGVARPGAASVSN